MAFCLTHRHRGLAVLVRSYRVRRSMRDSVAPISTSQHTP